MAKMAQWLVAGLALSLHAADAAPASDSQITLPSGDTVAVVKPTLSTKEMDLRLEKAIEALAPAKGQEQKAAPTPDTTITTPPVLTGYSLYPR